MSRKSTNPAIDGRTHEYHSEAAIISTGHLHLPLKQPIEPQGESHLFNHGGYLSQHEEEFRIEGVISFNRAYTQVAGNRSDKDGHGWTTLSTSVIEGLNVMEILTADRVVGQIITEHPLKGYVPEIRFLGTRIEGLKIAGHPVEIKWDYNILGNKPDEDQPYSTNQGVVSRVKELVSGFGDPASLPDTITGQYNRLSSNIGHEEKVECSLVTKVWGDFPGRAYGNIIRVPDFGTIELAKLSLIHERYEPNQHKPNPKIPAMTSVHLTMIDLKLGCAVSGDVPLGTGVSNGQTKP